MTKKTTPSTDGSDPSTKRDRPRLRGRMLRVLTSTDLDQVNGGLKRTQNNDPFTLDPDCPTN